MQKAYDTISEEELDKLIVTAKSADVKSKKQESWKLINQITGRKSVNNDKETLYMKSHQEVITKFPKLTLKIADGC